MCKVGSTTKGGDSMKDNKAVEKPVEVAKSEGELAQDFVAEYKALCEKHQFRLVISPAFVATNHGSFEVVLQEQIGRLPKQ